MRRKTNNPGLVASLLFAFAIGVAMMAGMKVFNWLVPDPPLKLEIRTTTSDRFA